MNRDASLTEQVIQTLTVHANGGWEGRIGREHALKLCENISERVGRIDTGRSVLEAFNRAPDDPARRSDLRDTIVRTLDEDPYFADYLRSIATQIPPDPSEPEKEDLTGQRQRTDPNKSNIEISNSTISRSQLAGRDIVHNRKFVLGTGSLVVALLLAGGIYRIAATQEEPKSPSTASTSAATTETPRAANMSGPFPQPPRLVSPVSNHGKFIYGQDQQIDFKVTLNPSLTDKNNTVGCNFGEEYTVWPTTISVTNLDNNPIVGLQIGVRNIPGWDADKPTLSPNEEAATSLGAMIADMGDGSTGCAGSTDPLTIAAGATTSVKAYLTHTIGDAFPRGGGIEVQIEQGDPTPHDFYVAATLDGVYPPSGAVCNCHDMN